MMTLMNLMNYSKVLCYLFSMIFPLQTKNIYNKADRKPWITAGILTSIRAKRRLEKKARSNPDRYLTIYWRRKNFLIKVTRLRVSNIIVPCQRLSQATVRKYCRILTAFLVKIIVQSIPPLNSVAFTLLSLKQLQMRSIPCFNSIPITLSDNINNNLPAFESHLDDQIPE